MILISVYYIPYLFCLILYQLGEEIAVDSRLVRVKKSGSACSCVKRVPWWAWAILAVLLAIAVLLAMNLYKNKGAGGGGGGGGASEAGAGHYR